MDCEGHVLAPGFIDIQFNGAFGVDYSDPHITCDDVEMVATRLLAWGVTTVCPTVISTSKETLASVMKVFRAASSRAEEAHEAAGRGARAAAHLHPMARSAGLHLEGPFLNPLKRGAHEERHLRLALAAAPGIVDTDDAAVREAVAAELGVPDIDWLTNEVRIMTLAPELEGGLVVTRALSRAGVTVSMGHTASGIKIADEAIECGATLITHLFNAMNMFHHRDPGIVGTLGRRPPIAKRIALERSLSPPASASASPQHSPSAQDRSSEPDIPMARLSLQKSIVAKSPVSRAAERLTRVSFISPFSQLPPTQPVSVGSNFVEHSRDAHADVPTMMLAPPQAAVDAAASLSGRAIKPAFGSGTPMTPAGASLRAATMVNNATHVRNLFQTDAAAADSSAPQSALVPQTHATPCALTVAPGDAVAAARPFYGLIADGVHVHPYAVSLAWETHPAGLVLVTDAMNALGLPVGRHDLGGQSVDVFDGRGAGGVYDGRHAVLAGTGTLAGAVEPLPQCVNNFMAFTGAPLSAALAAVTKHPAAALGLHHSIGTLRVGAWADLVLLKVNYGTRSGAASSTSGQSGSPSATPNARRPFAPKDFVASDSLEVLQTWVAGVVGHTRN